MERSVKTFRSGRCDWGVGRRDQVLRPARLSRRHLVSYPVLVYQRARASSTLCPRLSQSLAASSVARLHSASSRVSAGVVTQPTEAGPPRQIAPGLNHTLSLAE